VARRHLGILATEWHRERDLHAIPADLQLGVLRLLCVCYMPKHLQKQFPYVQPTLVHSLRWSVEWRRSLSNRNPKEWSHPGRLLSLRRPVGIQLRSLPTHNRRDCGPTRSRNRGLGQAGWRRLLDREELLELRVGHGGLASDHMGQ